jgi:hypothetical protein
MLYNLRAILPPEEIEATMHGMRTAFRSWGEEQDFLEKHLERAIGHIRGYGETEVSRRYSRQAKHIKPLVEIFNKWADFCLGGGEPASIKPASIIPFRRKVS